MLFIGPAAGCFSELLSCGLPLVVRLALFFGILGGRASLVDSARGLQGRDMVFQPAFLTSRRPPRSKCRSFSVFLGARTCEQIVCCLLENDLSVGAILPALRDTLTLNRRNSVVQVRHRSCARLHLVAGSWLSDTSRELRVRQPTCLIGVARLRNLLQLFSLILWR